MMQLKNVHGPRGADLAHAWPYISLTCALSCIWGEKVMSEAASLALNRTFWDSPILFSLPMETGGDLGAGIFEVSFFNFI